MRRTKKTKTPTTLTVEQKFALLRYAIGDAIFSFEDSDKRFPSFRHYSLLAGVTQRQVRNYFFGLIDAMKIEQRGERECLLQVRAVLKDERLSELPEQACSGSLILGPWAAKQAETTAEDDRGAASGSGSDLSTVSL
jgi:hypothetical protein